MSPLRSVTAVILFALALPMPGNALGTGNLLAGAASAPAPATLAAMATVPALDLAGAPQDVVAFHALLLQADAAPGDAFSRLLVLVDGASRTHAAHLGATWTLPHAARHSLPSEAALAVHAAVGSAPSAEQTAELRALDTLPAPQRQGIAAVLDAFLVYHAATQAAFAGRTVADIETAVEALDVGSSAALTAVGVDLGPVLAARFQLLTAFDALRASAALGGPHIQQCPGLNLDLAGDASTYTRDCALSIDVGGDDVYLNNAGGGRGGGQTTAAAAFDLSGNDQYRSNSSLGVNGGATTGAGLLVDVAGNDVYLARSYGTNGGGRAGAGLLMDAAGQDQYNAVGSVAINGGAEIGSGMLVDGGSADDVFLAGHQQANGGALQGVALLYDAGGNDRYEAGDLATNGGAESGVAMLWDRSGNDEYIAGDQSVNGAAQGGAGRLIDESGIDFYSALGLAPSNGGAEPYFEDGCGCAVPASGLLLDGAGTGDLYQDHREFDSPRLKDRTVFPKGQFGAQQDLRR